MVAGALPQIEPAPVETTPHPRRRDALVTALAESLVAAASLVGGYLVLANAADDELAIGTVRLSVDLRHRGRSTSTSRSSTGARGSSAIRLPARLHVDLRTVDREAVQRRGERRAVDLAERPRRGARRDRVLPARADRPCAPRGAGGRPARRVRGPPPGRAALRYTLAAAGHDHRSASASRSWSCSRRAGEIDEPQYYAFGADIPRALDAVEAAQRSTRALDQELDAQLVGLARLVTDPANRTPLADRPSITIASDLHNNFLAEPSSSARPATGRCSSPAT